MTYVPGVLLRDPDGIVAEAERVVRDTARSILSPASALAMGADASHLEAACKRRQQAVDSALAAEAIVARIAARARQARP